MSMTWTSIRYAWDKRETYQLAEKLSIPIPRSWFPRADADLAEIDVDAPLVLKLALRENFFYATNVKAWRVATRAELIAGFQRAAAIEGVGEVIVQELIPGDGEHQYAYCARFRDGRALASMTVRRRRQHPSDFGRAGGMPGWTFPICCSAISWVRPSKRPRGPSWRALDPARHRCSRRDPRRPRRKAAVHATFLHKTR